MCNQLNQMSRKAILMAPHRGTVNAMRELFITGTNMQAARTNFFAVQ